MEKSMRIRKRHMPKGLDILFEDNDILVVDKAPGLLTIGTSRERDRTAYHHLTDYVRKGNSKSRNRVFIVHRLDRDVSGILVFAKSHAAKEYLQLNWDQADKMYLAVVRGHTAHKASTISSYLTENAAHKVHATATARQGKLAHTEYKVLRESTQFSLLEVRLLTGRKHQIRVHLADYGLPIVGDKKYGQDEDRRYRRIALHARSLQFNHPLTGKQVNFSTEVPAYFQRLMGGDIE